MDNTSHLERMAEELKCPIRLSLLKSAVSLTCNHIFCNVCIDKSMKSDSTCPVCKIPYRRREVRPAPHMDTLVSIYKSMEVSSGVNILLTQTQPQPTGHENQVEDKTICENKATIKACKGRPNTQSERKNKGKSSKGSSKSSKRCNSDPERPSFPTKKRIQVPQHHPQETPTRPANLDSGKSELIKDRTQTNVSGPDRTDQLHENGEPLFSPFFWLRNEEEDGEKTTQLTPLGTVNDSLPDAPCFSDIKDSGDDVHSDHVTSKDVDMFDSEMFEWTQRPCSPEICASPMKMQEKESDGNEKDTAMLEVVLPTLSPVKIKKVDREDKVKGSKKRAKKTKESIQKKRVKKTTEKVVENCTVSLKDDQDKSNNTNELVKSKKQNLEKTKKIGTLISEIETAVDVNNTEKNKKKSTNQQKINRIQSSKKQDPSIIDGEIKACASRKQTEKGQLSNELKTSKKVTFSMNKSTKPTAELSGESNPTEKSNTTFLRKCDTLSNICCAFCQSTEESDISGCMTHYLKGKPITLDLEGVSSAIHAHRNCTEWAPNVYFEDDIAVNLEAELARSKRIKCSCCGLKCAALGCYEKTCRRSFHFTCAKLTPECRWDDDNFVMLCPIHASQKLPNELCGTQPKEKKKYVQKRQTNVKQSQVPVVFGDNVNTISRWDSHGLFTKIVLCCSALTTTEKEIIVKFEKLSGVTVLKTWDSRVTHVIASVDENGACRRTLKYLMGIIDGKWILNIEWIKACLEAKKPIDEQLYEINLDIHGFKGGPKLGRSRSLNKEPKLFNGLKFYFTGDFVSSYKGYLHDLIIAAGGTVLQRKPIRIINEKQFLIYSVELPDKLKPKEQNLVLSQRKSNAEDLAKLSGAVVVTNSWILNSIAACKLQDFN